MRVLRLVAVLAFGAAGMARAQLAISQPTEKLLLLPLPGMAAGDSAASIAVMDLARERVLQLARYKVALIPKSKICEALQSFGFPCDYIPDQTQAAQFAKALSINSYDVGTFSHSGTSYTARVRLVSGGSGFSSMFTATGNGQPAVAESLAQRVVTVIKAAESARECTDRRSKGNTSGALESAHKALAIDPNLTAAHLCMMDVYDLLKYGPDSDIAAGYRALKGDSLNSTAWSRIAAAYQQKGDTLRWYDALISWAGVESDNANLQLSVADQLMRGHQYPKATALLRGIVAHFPGNPNAKAMLRQSCIEGSQWRCVLDLLAQEEKDSAAKFNDSTELKLAIGASQALPDTQALMHWTQVAVTRFPKSLGFWNTRGQAFEAANQIDSAVAAYKAAAALAPNDPRPSLLVAATILNHTTYDTLHAPKLPDSLGLRAYQAAFADKIDASKPFIQPALAGTDTTLRINAAALMLTAGSGIARAGAYARAYPWLDQLLTLVQPSGPADTLGPKHQIMVQASFWYGLSSTLTMGDVYTPMTKNKSCEEAKAVNERLNRTKDALFAGARIAPQVVTQMLGFVGQYAKAMPQVKAAFKCTNF